MMLELPQTNTTWESCDCLKFLGNMEKHCVGVPRGNTRECHMEDIKSDTSFVWCWLVDELALTIRWCGDHWCGTVMWNDDWDADVVGWHGLLTWQCDMDYGHGRAMWQSDMACWVISGGWKVFHMD